MKAQPLILSFIALLWIFSGFAFGQDEDKKLEWSGNLDSRYLLLQSNQNSPFYKMSFWKSGNLSKYLSQYRNDLYLNADYQQENLGVHIKTLSTFYSDSATSFSLLEAYGNVNISSSSFMQIGKRIYSWGKGYAFNPVGYVNPLKNPENPNQLQQGIDSLSVEYVKSFTTGPLANFALTGILIPATNTTGNHYAQIEDTDIALKSYFLFFDTDIDLMGYLSRTNPKRIGLDFSRNIKENLEVHGELSYSWSIPKSVILENTLNTQSKDNHSWLLGLRYLNEQNTTLIAEYYHNGNGLTKDEFQTYRNFVSGAVSSGSDTAVRRASTYNKDYFNASVLMQDYIYFKASQPEPFGWLYFTPSLLAIYNVADGSALISAPLSFSPVTNFELIFWSTIMAGGSGTEFGSKQVQKKVEVWMRFYY
ncbi:MAG TPA: hypothetical protein DF296_00660 [Candidatus Margulisbacteria bacterium]|nr:MAG: hypothetical protein A2X09_17470 [Bacteroidetes bacterium GWF2_43_11]OGI11309.1 MAG: hypothetical protein A2X41_04285 [Candidatus Margulisbacteria bacterium GWE2_39_32]HCT83694.1 hypothetical protein [Candidatus Margulisiibacteriota bacterium]